MNKRTTRILTGFAVLFTLTFGASADAYASRNRDSRGDEARASFRTRDFKAGDARFSLADVRIYSDRRDYDLRGDGRWGVRFESGREYDLRYSDFGRGIGLDYRRDVGFGYGDIDFRTREFRANRQFRQRDVFSFVRVGRDVRADGEIRFDQLRAKESKDSFSVRDVDFGKDVDYRLGSFVE